VTTDPLVAEQRRRWARGDRVSVESLLAGHPTTDRQQVLELIYGEVYLRELAGDQPAVDEYMARFPVLADDIRIQFEVHEAVRAGPGVGPDVPGYRLVREIGRGGLGVVYEAADAATGRPVAVKVLRPDVIASPETRRRFAVEARAGALLDHPGVVPLVDLGQCAAGPYLVMEIMPGGSLEDRMRPRGLDPTEAAGVVAAVAAAVHEAHIRGVVHRDLKPANVLFDAAGRPRVADFGLAKLLPWARPAGGGSTRPGAIVGTPAYMAPEQAAGTDARPAPAWDVYALGAVLYAAVTGRPPFEEHSALATLLRVRSGVPPRPLREVRPDVPASLERVCHRCLSPRPEDRFPTAAAVATELAGTVGVRVVLVPEAGGPAVPLLIGPEDVVIGRADGCEVVLDTPTVSRRHCRLTTRDGVVFAADLGSRSGTTVGGRSVRDPTPLRAGDILCVAAVGFRVHYPA
jgi:eukaryotic-like serine/threonine-protein kinase